MPSAPRPPIGVIAVDAIFTPVRKVNYWVDPMRVGQMTNYDKLTIEIETDGTITPEEALSRSAEVLVNQFRPFVTIGVAAARWPSDGRRGAAAEHARHADRGTRPADAGLQLAEAKQHRQGRPGCCSSRTTTCCDAQLRQEVARRDEGAPARGFIVPETETDGLDLDAEEPFDDDEAEG